MLIDDPMSVLAMCAGAAAFLNLAMLKVSPTIKARTRHLLTGIGPVAAVLAGHIGLQDSVVASGTDLLVLGGSAVLGLAASVGSTRFVQPQRALPKA